MYAYFLDCVLRDMEEYFMCYGLRTSSISIVVALSVKLSANIAKYRLSKRMYFSFGRFLFHVS